MEVCLVIFLIHREGKGTGKTRVSSVMELLYKKHVVIISPMTYGKKQCETHLLLGLLESTY